MASENYITFKFWCLLIPFYWNTVSPIACVLSMAALVLPVAELSSYEDTRPKIFTHCPFTEKVCLPLSNLKTGKFLCRPLFPGKFTSISPLQQRHHAVLLMPVLCAHFLLDSHISWVLTFSPTPYNPWSHQNTTQVTLYTLETLMAKTALLAWSYSPVIFALADFFPSLCQLSTYKQCLKTVV